MSPLHVVRRLRPSAPSTSGFRLWTLESAPCSRASAANGEDFREADGEATGEAFRGESTRMRAADAAADADSVAGGSAAAGMRGP